MSYDVVVPTLGRPSLKPMLAGLASGGGPLPARVLVVDDRKRSTRSLVLDVPARLRDRLTVIRGSGRGPAAARNLGWRAGDSTWVAFLDDDVLPPPGWRAALAVDLLASVGAAASQGRVRVARAANRAPTDAARSVIGLEDARWATADIAYRRDALLKVGGFDERFPRAYREDADLGLRAVAAGGWIVRGRRWVGHPADGARWWQSLARQRGNADDALMLFLHGPGWERRAGATRGARTRHLAASAFLATGVASLALRRRKTAAASLAAWLGLTVGFGTPRIAAGPKTSTELAAMLATSAAIPLAAAGWWLFGLMRAWRLTRRPDAVLVDRDGTLIEDVPYNGDPEAVRLRPGVRPALDRLRGAGIPVVMITNQSGVATGILTRAQVGQVNHRVEELAGPLAGCFVCFHGSGDRCACRKPAPGLIFAAARDLRVRPTRCAMIGDVEADVLAAQRAGARGILVPNSLTRPDEVDRAEETARTLEQAVSRLLGPA